MDNFKKSFRPYLIIAWILFVVAFLQGWFFAKSDQGQALIATERVFDQLGFIRDWNLFQVFLFIFLNNTIKAFISMILGMFFGIVPLIFVLANGYILGIIVFVSGLRMGFEEVVVTLLPHGIIEIPIFLLASAYGFWLGNKFFKKIFKKEESFKEAYVLVIKKFFKIVLPLLLLAALIETYITPLIVSIFF